MGRRRPGADGNRHHLFNRTVGPARWGLVRSVGFAAQSVAWRAVLSPTRDHPRTQDSPGLVVLPPATEEAHLLPVRAPHLIPTRTLTRYSAREPAIPLVGRHAHAPISGLTCELAVRRSNERVNVHPRGCPRQETPPKFTYSKHQHPSIHSHFFQTTVIHRAPRTAGDQLAPGYTPGT